MAGAELTLGTLAADDDASPFIAYECPALGRLVAQASSNAVLADDNQLAVTQLAQIGGAGLAVARADTSANFTSSWSQIRPTSWPCCRSPRCGDVYGVLHPVFLTADQLGDVLQPPGPSEPPYRSLPKPGSRSDTHAVMPADAAELDRLVGIELESMYGSEPFHDSVGDYAIRVGSTMVFVRIPSDAKEVIAFLGRRSRRERPVACCRGAQRPELREPLGCGSGSCVTRSFVSMSALARPFVPAALQQVIHEVASVADSIDDHLAETLQGRTTFSSLEE